jgi:TRAP-type uncharacterized transport system fused permease subunit
VPAFLVPFMFVLDPSGQGLLLMGSSKALANANWWNIAEVTVTAAIGIAAGGSFVGFATLRAGEPAILRLSSGTTYQATGVAGARLRVDITEG